VTGIRSAAAGGGGIVEPSHLAKQVAKVRQRIGVAAGELVGGRDTPLPSPRDHPTRAGVGETELEVGHLRAESRRLADELDSHRVIPRLGRERAPADSVHPG
jgi:hypothetical protein